jgi:RNA polymerase sigma-B factor
VPVRRQQEQLDQPRWGADSREGAPLSDMIGARDAEIRRAFERVALEALLATLDDRERLILELYYQHELTQSEIAQRLGYSQMHISRLLRGAVEHLLLAASPGESELPRPVAV